MLLTISTTYSPATDIGFLLEKHPEKVHEFELAAGRALMFYPEATAEKCTAALLLDVDPIGLVRSRAAKQGDASLDQYVNDRPYVASSFLSVAIGTAFRSAMAGKSRSRPELAATPIPLEANLAALPCRGGESLLRGLFEPLGYEVEATPLPLDQRFPEWGPSPYYTVTLRGVVKLQDLLRHLYVLIPVLDDRKHYWVGDAEIEKLLRSASEWLAAHPLKERIAQRYLRHRRSLARQALEQLALEEPEALVDEELIPPAASREVELEKRVSLNEKRLDAVVETLERIGAKRVIDLGCGEGRLLVHLLRSKFLERIVGMDVSVQALERASERLHFDRLTPRQQERVALIHGSLMYRDDRLKDFDAATVIEVVEHLDPPRLSAFERVLFESARPRHVVLTTPNREYNVKFEGLACGKFRHGDHRFEWTREEFHAWCSRQCERFGYQVEHFPVGEEDPVLGPPTQLAVFSLVTTH
jgi:3' terminal RNA ribose 2'-O-methyltransferase Hen1